MKIIITEISQITPQLTKHYRYNVVDEENIVLENQTLESKPTDAENILRSKLEDFNTQYLAESLQVGMEIT